MSALNAVRNVLKGANKPPTSPARVAADIAPTVKLDPFNAVGHYEDTLGDFKTMFDPRSLGLAHNRSDKEPLVFIDPLDGAGDSAFGSADVTPDAVNRVFNLRMGSGPPLHIPTATARLDPETKALNVDVVPEDASLLDSLVSGGLSNGIVNGNLPLKLQIDGDIAGWNGNVKIQGRSVQWGRNLKGPGAEALLRNIDETAEAEAFAGNYFETRFQQARFQPRNDAQAAAAVGRMFDPKFALLNSGGRFGDAWSRVNSALDELRIPKETYEKIPGWGNYRASLTPTPDMLRQLGVTEEQIFGTKAWKKWEARATETQDVRRFMDDYFSVGFTERRVTTEKVDGVEVKTEKYVKIGGYFRAMEANDPERYAAMLEAVADTPYTRGKVYGPDVAYPNEPILMFHSGQFLNWQDVGRYFLQEGQWAKEIGLHAGDWLQSSQFIPGLRQNTPTPKDRGGYWSVDEGDRRAFGPERVDRALTPFIKDIPDKWHKEVVSVVMRRNDEQLEVRLNQQGIGVKANDDVIASDVLDDLQNWYLAKSDAEKQELQPLIGKLSEPSVFSGISKLEEEIAHLYGVIKTASQPHTMPFVVTGRRPFIIPDLSSNTEGGLASVMHQSGLWSDDQGAMDMLRQISREDYLVVPKNKANLKIQEMLEDKGFDHILYMNNGENAGQPSVIMWNPRAIKPVYGSKRFDRTNPNPAFSVLPWWAGMLPREEENSDAN